MYDKTILKSLIKAASKQEKVDLVIKNGWIVDVFTSTIIRGDVAIHKGYFVGIGSYNGKEEIDVEGRYLCPTFIDSHVHVESSMTTPYEYVKILLKHGVTAVISDPHEIGNVLGTSGIDYILNQTKDLPFDYYVMLPSCVTESPLESSGAVLTLEDIKPYFQHEQVLGLAEVMNYKDLVQLEDDLVEKIMLTLKNKKVVDGHAAGFNLTQINTYLSAQIKTDHEVNTTTEAIERLKRGMYVQIRQGTASKNLEEVLPAVDDHNFWRFMFCTDDKHIGDLIHDGSIDHNVRSAIQLGMPELQAIQLGTITASTYYGTKYRGAIAPGYQADFMILDDLKSVSITQVYKNGRLVVRNGNLVNYPKRRKQSYEKQIINSVTMKHINKEDFKIQATENCIANIVGINPGSLVTDHITSKIPVKQSEFIPSPKEDLLKVAVINRYGSENEIGVGIVKGFGLKKGAIASSVSHDAHNVIVLGTNDEDMVLAANKINDIEGGLVVVSNQQVLATLPLNVAGLMSNEPYQVIYSKLKKVEKAVHSLGIRDQLSPFLALSFMSLPVIPELKITTKGLVDVRKQKVIPVCE